MRAYVPLVAIAAFAFTAPAFAEHAPLGEHVPANGKAENIPTTWKGGGKQWLVHVNACAKAYPSYSPPTDMYKSHGQMKMCMLAMKRKL